MCENIKKQLEQALVSNELDIVYQPQYTHTNNKFFITGCEALSRLHYNDKLVPPTLFIPIAETSDQITRLGLYVLIESCKQLKEWIDSDLVNDEFTMSVNISAKHLNDKDCVTDILSIIKETGVPPNQLCLEITESVFLQDINIAVLDLLSYDGIKISIDDFGTGYSSLARLKFLPIDEIKIDKLFINDITKSYNDIAMMTALNQLSNALNLYCIVEGVESNDQLFILIGIGFTHFQGYFFSEPVSGSELTELIKLANF